jgi:hypothetical protein
MRTTKRAEKQALSQLKDELLKRDELVDKYQGRPIKFLEQYGYRFPDKIEELFKDIFSEKVQYAVVKSCRAGGKTQIASGLAFCFFFFKRWNVGVVAGSKEQALRTIEYCQDISGEPEVVDYVPEETKTIIKGKWGNWIKASPASTKAIRGLHAKGRGMLLILDEEAEMEEAIVRSALKVAKDAKPCIILRLSTFHKISGTFADLVDNHEKYGYRLYGWDSFDVAEKCTEDCATCLKDYYGIRPDIKEREKEFVAYCGGKAKKGKGWLPISNIRQAFIESPREWFEVEDMGMRPSGEGMVLPLEKVKKAFDNDDIGIDVTANHWFGIDWGFKGMTAIHTYQQFGDLMQLVDAAEFTEIALPLIVEYLREQSLVVGGTTEVFADSSHPFENNQLKNEGFDVTEVVFGAYKETGAGWLRFLMERERYKAPRRLTRTLAQMSNWRRGKDGKIVKKNDHHCDAALAATKRLEDSQGGTVSLGPRMIPKKGAGFMEWWNRLRGRQVVGTGVEK